MRGKTVAKEGFKDMVGIKTGNIIAAKGPLSLKQSGGRSRGAIEHDQMVEKPMDLAITLALILRVPLTTI